jgi:4-hydroxy-2-oxoheptanedioate aldolase
MYPSPGVVERIGADWDWIWVDGQHGELGYNDTLSLVRACDLIRRPAIVRVPSHEYGGIGRVLDMGASGVIVPLVDTGDQARRLVMAAKFPPLGERSYGARRACDLQGRLYAQNANAEVLLIAQIETPEGLRNVDDIAAVDGIDAIFLGPDDLMLRLGFKMDETRPIAAVEKDLIAVARACEAHGKLAVSVAFTAETLALCLAHGYHLIAAGSDVGFLAGSSKQVSARARESIERSRRLDDVPVVAGNSILP